MKNWLDLRASIKAVAAVGAEVRFAQAVHRLAESRAEFLTPDEKQYVQDGSGESDERHKQRHLKRTAPAQNHPGCEKQSASEDNDAGLEQLRLRLLANDCHVDPTPASPDPGAARVSSSRCIESIR
jgi:hypothetical protein